VTKSTHHRVAISICVAVAYWSCADSRSVRIRFDDQRVAVLYFVEGRRPHALGGFSGVAVPVSRSRSVWVVAIPVSGDKVDGYTERCGGWPRLLRLSGSSEPEVEVRLDTTIADVRAELRQLQSSTDAEKLSMLVSSLVALARHESESGIARASAAARNLYDSAVRNSLPNAAHALASIILCLEWLAESSTEGIPAGLEASRTALVAYTHAIADLSPGAVPRTTPPSRRIANPPK